MAHVETTRLQKPRWQNMMIFVAVLCMKGGGGVPIGTLPRKRSVGRREKKGKQSKKMHVRASEGKK